jgi:peptidoglycan/LPS O-acetylase OafA/YrhL
MNAVSDSPNLDLLRTLAVLYVVIFHLLLFFEKTNLGLLWNVGHWGVLLFFVHTSLVLMFSLERQEARLPNSNIFGRFYLRRCFRILPLSVLVVTVLALTSLPAGHLYHGQFRTVHLRARGVISNLLLIQNVTGADSITAPLWSLPYEMQMYLIFPVLYLCARTLKTKRSVVGIWFATALLAYIVKKVFHDDSATFLTLAPCFMAGVVSYKLSKLRVAKLPFVAWPCLILLTTYLYLRHPSPQRSWVWCLVVGVAIPFFSEMRNVWLRKTCQVIAQYSYGIYLVHFVCIWFAFVELSKLPLLVRWIFFAVTVTAVPIALYHFVEAPMISLGRQVTENFNARTGAIAR